MTIQSDRRRLALIRCLQECIECFRDGKKIPESLCYVPSEVEYRSPNSMNRTALKVHTDTQKSSKKLKDIVVTNESRIFVSGEEECNSQGKWLRLLKFKATATSDPVVYDTKAWILLYTSTSSSDDSAAILPHIPDTTIKSRTKICSWRDVVEHNFALHMLGNIDMVLSDQEAVNRLREIPQNWSIEHDEDLVRIMSQYMPGENEHLGNIKNYVESIDVSSYCEEANISGLTDGDPDTYWESDGSQGQHWVQLRMKKGTIIKKLQLTIDGSDDNYLPARIVVQGGEQDSLKTLVQHRLEDIINNCNGSKDINLLSDMTEHHPIIMIQIKECKAGGIDCRIRGIKITSTEERSLGFDRDFFKGENLIRYPKLETYPPEQLYRRSIVLQRFMDITDSVLHYIVPAWEYSVGSYSSLEYVRQLLPLSKKRLSLIETFLKESATERPSEMPKLFLNRRLAMEHKCEPTLDPEYKNAIFTQMYEGLKSRDRQTKQLDYRWPSRYDQWWECKLMSEGVIDQGGGFRDSLSDLAEELCPTSSDVPIPVPFFVRAPNQLCEDSNVNRDVYVPNPACKAFSKYEWLGQLMGACLRGKENLVVTLPSFIWKKLVGERVSWSRDYHTVDMAEVKLTDGLEISDEETFNAVERTWSTLLSDHSLIVLRMDADGNSLPLKYEDRVQYCNEVRKARMTESDEQVAALRRGLLKVIPQAVLDLLTWQELEHRISGDPEITLEALKRAAHYDDLDEKDTRTKYLWEALKNFSNEDRSRFLRFVTGRRRLPAPLYVTSGKGDAVDCLPESSTCANTLYLPNYSSAKVAEEKLRYAAYNCVDLDTDMNPWDD